MDVRVLDVRILPPPPTVCVTTTEMTAERLEIYRRVNPPGNNFLVDTEPFLIDD